MQRDRSFRRRQRFHGTKHCYDALRLAGALIKNNPEGHVSIFRTVAAVLAAKANQRTPNAVIISSECCAVFWPEVLLWGACMDARGLADAEMMAGARRTARPSE